jgi:hypothetical protein
MRETLELVLRFVVQMFVAAFLFLVVGGVAYVLWLVTEWLQKQGVPDYIRLGASGVAALLFMLDVLCFVGFTVAETWKLLRTIWKNL